MILYRTLDAIHAEAERAHELHGETSMRSFEPVALDRLAILMEEVGEVGRVFNEARHRGSVANLSHLYSELVQVAAMAADWANAVGTAMEG